MNCAAIPSELIESELFGHMKGSFTGAHEDRAGKFELADGGTLFLDEIGDMSLAGAGQGAARAAGGDRHARGRRQADPRSTCACWRRPTRTWRRRSRAGRFREDLYYRLNVIPLHVPPLRERREDIAMLVRHFTETYARDANLRPKPFTDEALERMQRMDWPGNVRELRNTVERLMILAGGATVSADDVELLVGGRMKGGGLSGDLLGCTTFAEFKEAAERAFILQKLRENDWNVSETARLLDMPRSNLYKKIERYELVREG